MKSYTDVEQSKKLSSILPLESADMWFQYTGASYNKGVEKPIYFPVVIRDSETDKDIPCWSLAALFNIIPKRIDGSVLRMDMGEKDFNLWFDFLPDGAVDIILPDITKSESIDACVQMILELHEQNLL